MSEQPSIKFEVPESSFAVVACVGGVMFHVPAEAMTDSQRAAVRHILSRVGKDPTMPAELAIQEPSVEKPAEVRQVGSAYVPSKADLNHRRAVAKQQGYTGDMCSNCQGVRTKRNGSCLVCEDCGTTTGCS